MNIYKINSLEYCLNCDDLCINECPSYNYTKNRYYSPKNIAKTVYNSLKNNIFDNTELIYACIHCSKCEEVCPHSTDISEIALFAKEEMILHEKVDNYITDFEEIFYKNGDSKYSNFDLKKILEENSLNRFINDSDTIFIPTSDTLYYSAKKIEKLYDIFKKLELTPSLHPFKSDSWLSLYYLGYKDEVITDLKRWLYSLRDIELIVTSSFKLIHILKRIAVNHKLKVPKVIDIFSYLIQNNFKPNKFSFTFIGNSFVDKYIFDYKILEKFSDYLFYTTEDSRYLINDTIFDLFYNMDKNIIKEYLNKINKDNIDFIVVPNEETKKLFIKHNNSSIKIITIMDLILK